METEAMETQKLAHTDFALPRICLGTMTFGSQVDDAEAARIVDFCLGRGANFFDTANVYNQGESERVLGRCIRGRRDRVVVASKVRGAMQPDGETPGYEGLSRAAIVRAVDESLRRLGTDYLDIYYFHQPDYAVPIEESLAAMDDLVRAGKVRFPALSNYAAWQVTEAQWIAAGKGYAPARITQPMYNLLARGLEQEYLPMCRRFGVFTCIYNPLAGGLLTGKHTDRPAPGSRFETNRVYIDRYWHPAYFQAVDELAAAARESGRSLVSLALNWIYRHSSVDCIILGASRLGHLEQNLAALDDGPLPEGVLRACDAVWEKLRGVTPKYNR